MGFAEGDAMEQDADGEGRRHSRGNHAERDAMEQEAQPWESRTTLATSSVYTLEF